MQCACTSAVDKVLAYCLAGSRQETTGQVIYMHAKKTVQLHAKQEANVLWLRLRLKQEASKKHVIADRELNSSSWSINDSLSLGANPYTWMRVPK